MLGLGDGLRNCVQVKIARPIGRVVTFGFALVLAYGFTTATVLNSAFAAPSPIAAKKKQTESKQLARAKRDPDNPSLCILVGPAKDPRWQNTPGLEQSDLSLFERTSEAHAPLVTRYRSGALRVGSPKNPRLTKSDDCAFMDRLAIAINDSFYAVPTMECKGGPFIYRYRPLGFNVEMDTILKAGPQGQMRRVVSHEWMNLTNTGNKRNGCLIRVTQATPNQKQFKMCLPALSAGPGRVAMLYEGRNLPPEAMQISCTAEPGFEGVIKELVSDGVTPKYQPQYQQSSQPSPYGPSGFDSGFDSGYDSDDAAGNASGGGSYNVYQ